jgi:hypothetical protein
MAARGSTIVLLGVLLGAACHVGKDDACSSSEFVDHCEGDVAVTCPAPNQTGSGYNFGGDTIERETCAPGACGEICYCWTDRNSSHPTTPKLEKGIGCNPDPKACSKTCT